jgi:hypothetical protein
MDRHLLLQAVASGGSPPRGGPPGDVAAIANALNASEDEVLVGLLEAERDGAVVAGRDEYWQIWLTPSAVAAREAERLRYLDQLRKDQERRKRAAHLAKSTPPVAAPRALAPAAAIRTGFRGAGGPTPARGSATRAGSWARLRARLRRRMHLVRMRASAMNRNWPVPTREMYSRQPRHG